VTIDATSSVVATRLRSDDGHALAKKPSAMAFQDMPSCLAIESRNSPKSPLSVGPASTEFTVTPLAGKLSASPRATASCAVLLIP